MGRFKDLYRYTDGWYSPNCPVIILAGALLQDTEDNALIAQLKLRNISNKSIVCCKVSIKTFEVNGKECEEIKDFSYLDINVALGGEFGVQTPIKLTSNLARKFVATVSEVVYSDSKVVRYDDDEWTSIPSSIPLDAHLKAAEQVKQFQLECGDNYRFLPQKIGGLFLCACDTINQGEDSKCTSCGRRYSYFEPKLDIEYLNSLINERKEKERLELEQKKQLELERQAARKEKLNRIKKITIKCAIVLAAVVLIGTLIYYSVTKFIPDYKYSKAVKLHTNCEYDAAIDAFSNLNGYRDSEQQIIVCTYDKAMSLIANADYDNGYQLLRTVSANYDVESIITQSEYSRGIQFLENGEYETAIPFFEYAIDYEDSQDKIYQCYYELGRIDLENGSLQSAVDNLLLANNYADSSDYLKTAYDLQGDDAFNAENYDDAIVLYELSDNENQISECYFHLAEASYSQGEYLEAAGYYENASTHAEAYELAQESYYNYVLDRVDVEGESSTYYGTTLTVLNKIDEELYPDVSDMILETTYNKADAYFEEGNYSNAVTTFNSISDYRDSSSRIKEAKYQYVLAHRNNSDSTTYSYLCDLKSAGYRDASSIYRELYAWSATVTFTSGQSSSSSTVTSFSRYSNFYAQIELSGGTPSGDGSSTTVRYTMTFPDGSTYSDSFDGTWRDGYTGTCWGYYSNPQYGRTGTFTVRVYDGNNNLIGQASVSIT